MDQVLPGIFNEENRIIDTLSRQLTNRISGSVHETVIEFHDSAIVNSVVGGLRDQFGTTHNSGIGRLRSGTFVMFANPLPLASHQTNDQLFNQLATEKHESGLRSEDMNSWEFNALSLSMSDSFLFLEYVFCFSNFFKFPNSELGNELGAFFEVVHDSYHENNRYHNWSHAIDVTQTVYMYLKLSSSSDFLKIWISSVS